MPPIAPAPRSPREKGAFPLVRPRALSGRRPCAAFAGRRCATRSREHGIRNALLTSIAPTGTISLFAGNVSSGIEPIFSISYERKVLMPDGTRRSERIEDYAARLFRAMHGSEAPLPASFVTTADLTPHQHLVMQAAVQRHVDSSISKTINCPSSLSFEEFKTGLCASLRTGPQGLHDLQAQCGDGLGAEHCDASFAEPAQPALPLEAPRDPVLQSEPGEVIYMKRPLERREVLPGFTYKLKWPESDHAIYITLNDIVQDGRRRPFEIFINSKNMEHYAWTVALTRMISAVFRRGGDVSFVVEELKAVFDPRGGQWMGGKYVPSLLGGDRRRHREASGRYRLPQTRCGLASARARRGDGGGRPAGHRAMPALRRGRPDLPGGLRALPQLRLFEMRLIALDGTTRMFYKRSHEHTWHTALLHPPA